MPFITLHGEPGNRLGAHIMSYLNQLFYAHSSHYYIRYDLINLPYAKSPFVTLILSWVDRYNLDSGDYFDGTEVFPQLYLDWSKMMYQTLEKIKMDFAAFWREVYPEIVSDCFSSISSNYSIPLDPKKTIAVHLRLDDVHDWWDYNGTASANYYRDLIQCDASLDEMSHVHTYGEYPNIQSPIPMDRVEIQIQDAKRRYPDHEVIIISSPTTRHLIQTDYRVICNTDESHDLFLLSISDVVILSRSTFAICSVIFGNHSRIYAPLWGQWTYYGFYTKFHLDSEHFSYFW